MRINPIIKFLASLTLFILSIPAFTQEQNKPFDYTTTIWIINALEGSGVVYGRPKPDEYNERQGFIYIYEILIKYVYNMQDINTAAATNSLSVTQELILINGTDEQRILLGDHWISDETKIAVMNEEDYKNLKAWLEERASHKDKKINPPLDKLTKAFRLQTPTDVEDFNNYFKSSLSKPIPAHSKLDNTDEHTNHSISQKSSLPFQSSISQNHLTQTKAASKNFITDELTDTTIKPTSEKSTKLNQQETGSTHYYIYGFILCIGILVSFVIGYFYLRKI